MSGTFGTSGGSTKRDALDMSTLVNFMQLQGSSVIAQLSIVTSQGSQVSIGMMFQMQMLMNHFSQASEMSSALFSAMNTEIVGMAKAMNR
jgi:ABC-type uncharacterized transport system YnjBCD ATPase subunit